MKKSWSSCLSALRCSSVPVWRRGCLGDSVGVVPYKTNQTRGNDTIWSIASNNDAATAAGPTVRFHLLRELVGVSFELREARVPVQHLVHGWRPRPRRHGGFRRADDLLAWLQRRLRAVDHERPLLPPFYPYRDQRRLFNLYWFFWLQLKLKPPIRNRQCACNRQPPPPQLRRDLRGRDLSTAFAARYK